MKKLLLSVLALTSLSTFATPGLEITSADLKWEIGNEWYMKVTSSVSIGDFISAGSGLTWDLTSYEDAVTEDTIVIGSATGIGGALGASLSINSTLIPLTDYATTGTNFEMTSIYVDLLGGSVGFNGNLEVGLAHVSGDSWAPVTGITNPLNPSLPDVVTTLTGSVLAQGTVVTSYGSFEAFLVKEQLVVDGATDQTFYYWETKEYGRIATIMGNKLSVMHNNNFDIITSNNEVVANQANIFPNPATDNFTVKVEGLENVKVYNALGTLVSNENVSTNATIVNASSLNAGVYFVQATANGTISTSRVIVK
tara:strand:- start:545 stop:1474 length:930 start_codon:yes stop_codon:yes gene_type:complete